MTRRERVRDALLHKETDIIPYSIHFTGQEYERVANYVQDPNFYQKVGSYVELIQFTGFLREEENHPGYFTDDFGVRWNRNGADKDIGVIDGILIPEPEISSYRFPQVRKDELNKQYNDLLNNGNDTFKVAGIGFSMFERAWTLRGMENFLIDMVLEPEFAESLLDRICEFNLQIIDIALSYDIDAFYFGDDWGQQKGLIMGPKFWRQFIKPRMARMYERVRASGKFVIQHSCGDIGEIYPDLIEMGLNVYQSFQPEIYDIQKIKKQYGKHLSFWGGISTQRLLPFATPEQVQKKTVEIMKVMGKDGGYIAAPTHDVPADVPPQNILAMLDVFQRQHQYL